MPGAQLGKFEIAGLRCSFPCAAGEGAEGGWGQIQGKSYRDRKPSLSDADEELQPRRAAVEHEIVDKRVAYESAADGGKSMAHIISMCPAKEAQTSGDTAP